MKQSTLNHEAIHVRQWEECMIASAVLLTVIMLFTGFNLWVYLLCPLWFYLQYGLEYALCIGNNYVKFVWFVFIKLLIFIC